MAACLYKINRLENYWSNYNAVRCNVFRVARRRFIAIEIHHPLNHFPTRFGDYVR